MSRLSIRWRITLWNTAAFAAVLTGFGVLVYSLLRETHYDQVDRTLESRYREVVKDENLAANPEERFRFWVRKFGKHIEMFGIVLDAGGNPVAEAEQLKDTPHPPVPRGPSSELQFDNLTLPRLGHVRRLSAVVPTEHGSYTLMLFAELEHVDEELGQVTRALLMTIPITLGIAAALAYWLAYKALSPVEQLRRLADEITAEHLDRRLPIPNPADELGLLAQTVNSMIARLERSFEEVRRFTADASHELRTPIAVIRSEAEMGEGASINLEDARSRFRSIVEECSRLASATSQLLALSREDAGVHRLVRESVPLKPLLGETIESLRPLANAKRQHLQLNVACDAEVVADAARLRQVFHNLIDNAIKYTPNEGRITVGLTCTATQAVVSVADTGIGIKAAHLSRIFDRFYRINKSSDRDAGGVGLGLSIVHSIVASLGGRADVESKPGKGSVFQVYLPIHGTGASQQDTEGEPNP